MTRVQDGPIEPTEVLSHVADPSCGGQVLFLGTVRDHADGRAVTRMEYHGYREMAAAALASLEKQILARWPGTRLAIVHRLGALALGDVSVAVAAAAPHRAEAFEAARFGIDELKRTVPIWKREWGPDGASWVEGAERTPAG